MIQAPEGSEKPASSLRQKILAFVGALVLLILLGSTISLYRITEVNRFLDHVNRVSVPLGRIFTQMQSDTELFQREFERGLGEAHWKDAHWRPRPVPKWIEEVLESESARAAELMAPDLDWIGGIQQGIASLKVLEARLYTALEQKNEPEATQLYSQWSISFDQWKRQLQWGASEYERALRQNFGQAESRVSELKAGLEVILVVVISLSLLLLWLGERALRPLSELTGLARQITRRGLRKEDKAMLPEIPLSRVDEVSQLAREFHRMATALLEREKEIEMQKGRLQEQNRLLFEMGELNENVLNSIESVLVVTDLEGKITQCNPIAARWLGKESEEIIGTSLRSWSKLDAALASPPSLGPWLRKMRASPETLRIEPHEIESRIFGGNIFPLLDEQKSARGAIIVLEDLTDELGLEERLRRAENLAAVGRMSAQVAHEVRNPLHSIGLEAELASELASKTGTPALRQSLQSILASVDRLEKITENYLRLSRLSAGEKREVDMGEVLESVLATYASVCEQQGIRVDWRRERSSHGGLRVWGDPDLLEQSLGNLFRNAIQAFDSFEGGPREIHWALGSAESGRVWLRIEDTGPGITPEIRKRLFTPFHTTKAQGTGLGLSFVKQVLEEHGGTIECLAEKDQKEGQGAVFEIRLPAMKSAETGQERARADAPLAETGMEA